MTVEEGDEIYNVVIVGSMGSNPGFQFVNNTTNPTIVDQYKKGFSVLSSLSVDIPLASHPAMYNMADKYERLGQSPNPYIDPEGYRLYFWMFLRLKKEMQRLRANNWCLCRSFKVRFLAINSSIFNEVPIYSIRFL